MTKKVSKSPSQLSPLQNSTALASVLQKISQALLDDCSQASTSKGSASTPEQALPEPAEQHQAPQQPEPDQPMFSGSGFGLNQNPPKLTKRQKKCQTLAFDQNDLTAFVDKELDKHFEEKYMKGKFRDEIRYYYVPWYMVRFEHRFLQQHQPHTFVDLLSTVHNELNLKSKLITCLGNEAESSNLPLTQLSESILQTLRLLQKIQDHLKSFKLVHKIMLPHRHILKNDSEV